ncbi:MAG: hypothetical protein K940chlam9_01013 [Chlamydiae bacterium]|nr:hypothetical protein [Chlamydiota bacterium]
MIAFSLFFTLLATSPLVGSERQALYNSLDPQSVAKALAFYELYPGTEEGNAALARATELLDLSHPSFAATLTTFINRGEKKEEWSEEEVEKIEKIAAHLPNRKLQGYHAQSEEEVVALPSREIDLGMALLLSQMKGESGAHLQARRYSAMLDLMAMQIIARLPRDATPEEKIAETNRYIFDEMHFRFPPQSVYAQDIDLYTFLPSVMDNHLGVCLGVTALYLAIAQRIELPLEVITPPGHIYVRYREGEKIVNIETTARGINTPSETYLSVNTRHLEERTIKEVIGMTHVNQASLYLHLSEFEKAAPVYEQAMLYMPGDPLVTELLGYSYLFLQKKREGKKLLKEIAYHLPDHYVARRKLAEDYLKGKVGKEGIRAVFQRVDETRKSILQKQEELQVLLQKHPQFRDGWQQLAVGWIQLKRFKEAIAALETAQTLDPEDPVIPYYLSVLYGERFDLKKCWENLHKAEAITQSRNFSPKPLKDLRKALSALCPEL